MYEDKTLICKDCHKEFVFTAGEQEFYAEKGFVNEFLMAVFARLAARRRRQARCMRQFAMIAAESQEFLSSPARTSLFIAALALRRERTTHKDIFI